MAGVILVVIIIFLAANGNYTLLYIAGGFLALAFLCGLSGKGKVNEERPRTRICHEHYMSPDEYECTVCGARFGKDVKTCPNCGVRFNRTEDDDEEFIEEMVIWDDD